MTARVPNEKPILFTGAMVNAILADRKSQTRRLLTPKRTRVFLPKRVFADPTVIKTGHEPSAPRGYYPARIGVMGSVFITIQNGPNRSDLRLKPGEFEWVCPYAEGTTMLRNGKWIVTPKPGASLWVRETWGYADQYYGDFDEKGGPGAVIAYQADHTAMHFGGERPTRVKRADLAQWNWARMRWRPSIFLRRWASRITLDVREVRLERLQDITEDDAYAEGVPASLMNAGESCRTAYARLWDTINPTAPWKSDPWIWVVSFARAHLAWQGKVAS